MKTNRTIIQKLILSIICIMLIVNFTVPNYSHADSFANTLFNPIKGLVCVVADTVMFLIRYCFIGYEDIFTEVGHGDPDRWGATFLGGENEIEWPEFDITPEEIFKNKVPALNVNFLRPIKSYGELDSEEKEMTKSSTQTALGMLRNTISAWYMALRNITIIGLLSVLVYIGIRMMLCSIASEKAKYKQMLMDWVVAMILVFALHFIMSFTMVVVEQITKIFDDSYGNAGISLMQVDMENDELEKNLIDNNKSLSVKNLMEYVRVYVSLADARQSLTFLIIYVWLVVYTVKFIITYIKRFIHMAFLTMIAPLVALTYPIDKISDGKAQAFNMWLKDYIFNALIQPFHLIIYTIFVAASINLATTNMIYACVAIGFISQAEKFMRKMFGFDKAPNAPGGLASFGAGALAGNLLSKATSAFSKGGKGGSGGNGGAEGNAPKPPKTQSNADGYMSDEQRQSLNSGDSEGTSEGPDGSNPYLNAAENGEGTDAGGEEGNPNLRMQEELEQGPDGEQGLDGEQLSEEETAALAGLGVAAGVAGATDTTISSGGSDGSDTSTPRESNVRDSSNTKDRNKEKKEISGVKKLGKGVWNVAKKQGLPMLGKIGKGALKTGGAVLGGAIGGIGALATGGDVSKGIMTGASAGIGVGAAAGNIPSAIGSAGRGVKNAALNTKANFISSYDKAGADELRYKQQFMNDKAKKDYVRNYFANADGGALSGKELKAKMEQLYDYERAGITDIDSQKELMDMENKKIQEGYSEENARQQVLYANEMASKMDKKQLMEKSEMLKDDHIAKLMDQGYTEQQAKTVTDKTFDDIYAIKGMSASGMRKNEQKRAQQKIADAQAAEAATKKAEADRKRNEDFQNAIIDLAKNAKK